MLSLVNETFCLTLYKYSFSLFLLLWTLFSVSGNDLKVLTFVREVYLFKKKLESGRC